MTNAGITNYPTFLEKEYIAPKVKHQVKNFKRSLYVANEHLDELDFDSMETDDTSLIPVVLKDITTVCEKLLFCTLIEGSPFQLS